MIHTANEVADQLRVNTATITRYAKQGMFPGAFKVGKNWRIPADAIQQFINANAGVAVDAHQVAPRNRRARTAKRSK